MAGQRRLLLSKLYSFARGKLSFGDDHSQIGSPGFSRVAFANNPKCFEATSLGYPLNSISTTKYNAATFIPKCLFEQFRRVAYVYFLIASCLSYTPVSPYSGSSDMIPLVIVIVASMVKEAREDRRRKLQDNEVNSRKVKVHHGGGMFDSSEWKDIRVGDIVKIEKDQFFPADLILLSSSYEDAICYVETMNLDGETNLKLKQSLEVTSSLQEGNFHDFTAVIRCEDPNANLYSFVGSIEVEGRQYPLSPQQVLLRDSKLRNTDFIYGAVVFTGHDTKVMQNATKVPSKRSKIERKIDKIVYFLLFSLAILGGISAIVFGITTKNDLKDGKMKRWYLRPDDTDIYFDPKKAAVSAILQFFTAMMLYGYFIPISLYISLEIVKSTQARFIDEDIQMYHEESDTPAHARTSNLNEVLGQVDTVLSDKTGTLTCNSMEFIKCSIAGAAYGHGVTEVEKAMDKMRGSPLVHDVPTNEKSPVKGFNFTDDRIMSGNWIKEPNSDVIQKFFRLLAICQTCIPEVDEESGKISYEAESPDEAAFVVAAREIGFEFYQRAQTSICLREFDPLSRKDIERSYKLLHILEFNSSRKRMSVIVRDEQGKILLLSKGADSVMFERLAKNTADYEEATKEHINVYADAGLRTLVLAYRELDEREYAYFDNRFTSAKNSLSDDRDVKVEEAADMIEKDLILLGATAVEDKLQDGVPECIDKLARAGIKIWVLTGDKMETAINIGFACSLLRQGMKQIIINLESPDIVSLEKSGNKDAIAKASKASVVRQINDGKKLINSLTTESFALIIDGNSLAYALEDDIKDIFLLLAMDCGSVICCRSSPKQKALVTKLVKLGSRRVTLAIGDGANDVGMLQEADIGVGISGAEGMQAVMASDISIAQFRFLERLLLVHGHWCYRRITSMICYFFYENIVFGVTLFLYTAYASFSADAAYNDWAMSLYNVFFTSVPVVALGVFDQDVSARYCLKYPILYQEGTQNLLFRWSRILGWMLNGAISAVLIFFLLINALQHQAFRRGGQVIDVETLGATMYTCVVWAVNCQMAISMSFFTLRQHIYIWGSIAAWYLFLLVFGALSPSTSTTAYMVFIEELAPAPSYWIITLLIVIAALIPYFIYAALRTWFFPMFHNTIQWLECEGRADDPEFSNTVRARAR